MSDKRKKTEEVENKNSDDEVMTDASEESTGMEEIIEVDFEGRNIEGEDFHGVKQLLEQLFPTGIDCAQMADMLIAQAGVGSVLKQCANDRDDEADDDIMEDSTVFGLTTVLNLGIHTETPCVQQLYKLIKEKSMQDKSVHVQVEDILSKSSKIGFLINERFINIAATVSIHTFGSLHNEIKRMQKRDPSYKFEYYLIICKTYKPKPGGLVQNASAICTNAEEDIFLKHADCKFEFSVEDKMDTGVGGEWDSEAEEFSRHRVVAFFKADKVEGIINEVIALLET